MKKERRAGRARPESVFFLRISFFYFFSSPFYTFFGRYWEEGEGGGPLRRHGSSRVAAGDADRGKDMGKKNVNSCSLPWPFGPHVAG